MAMSPGEVCPMCASQPQVVVAIAHRAMRGLIVDLLGGEENSWAVSAVDGVGELGNALPSPPDLVVIDAADFASCCGGRLGRLPVGRVVVIGPEPDPAYRQATLDRGAGAWTCRDHVGEELSGAIRSVLGCSCWPCPAPARKPRYPPPATKENAR